MIFILDNYDSFTYNLAQYVGTLDPNITVLRNDVISCEDVLAMQPQGIIISPGPKTPNEAGITKKLLETAMGKIPILGVCLGHQALGEVLGAKVIRASEAVHGKSSLVYHNNNEIFKGLPASFDAARYHSLIIDKATITPEIEIIAETQDNVIMAIKATKYKNVWGVQFHPESILTKHGFQIIQNFVEIAHQN